MPSISPKYLTEKQAAEYTGFKPATFRHSRWSGKLGGVDAPKHVNLGRSIRYRVEDLDNWLASLEVSA